jgi:hypothetical protein
MDLFLSLFIVLFIIPRIFSPVPSSEVKSETVDSPEPEVISETKISTKIETSVGVSSVSPTATPQASSISEYQYPGSGIVSSSDSSLVLSSSDESTKITDWYKEKIKSKNMNATSFVSTSANNSVLNKLEGAGEGGKISVEIKKDEGSAQVTISVNISS